MNILLPLLLCAALASAWLAILIRRAELQRMATTSSALRQAKVRGTHRAHVKSPRIDLARCLGCSACIQSCPEDGVLDLLHGQAALVLGSNCVGHGHCEQSCPTGALRLEWGALAERSELPQLHENFEVHGKPGLYLVGEATGHGLIRNAVQQGRQVAQLVSQDYGSGISTTADDNRAYDLLVIGAGPGGLACAIEARQAGLRVGLVERESVGGTITQYPRSKLILTKALNLPGYGVLEAATYGRDELLDIWAEALANGDLELLEGHACTSVLPRPNGGYRVQFVESHVDARLVCLAIGRRGLPKHLGVPGETLPKVHYALDQDSLPVALRMLVVGGGDSALESALRLAEDSNKRVTLVHRGDSITRPNAQLREALQAAVEQGHLRLLLNTEVISIHPAHVLLLRSGTERIQLTNERVIIQIGGDGSRDFLRECGVNFDSNSHQEGLGREREQILADEARQLQRNLGLAVVVAALVTAWCIYYWGYYGLSIEQRPLSTEHGRLRPSGTIGLSLGWLAILCLLTNLSYVLRRLPSKVWRWLPPKRWFSVHVASGLFVLPLILVHGAMQLSDTTGGHAAWVLLALVLTGSVGRYVYAFLPRAANGRHLAFEEVREELQAMTRDLRQADDPLAARAEIIAMELCDSPGWRGGTLSRLWHLAKAPSAFRKAERRFRLEAEGMNQEPQAINELLDLLKRAHVRTRGAAYYEDLRALLALWRQAHVWTALLLVFLIGVHILDAWNYGSVWPW